MNRIDETLSKGQMRAVIFSVFSGTMLFTVPFRAANACGENLTANLLFGGIAAALSYGILAALYCNIQDRDDVFFKALNIIASVHMSLFAGECVYIFSDFAVFFMLRDIKRQTVAVVLVLAAYIASNGTILQKGRMSQITAVLMAAGIAFILIFSAYSIEIQKTGMAFDVSHAMLVPLYFDMPAFLFVIMQYRGKEKAYHNSTGLMALAAFVLPFTAVIKASGDFGQKYAASHFFSAAEALSDIDFPGFIVQRQEALVTGIVITSVFTLVSVYIVLCAKAAEKTFGHRKILSALFAAVVCVTGIFPENTTDAFAFLNRIDYSGVIFAAASVVYVCAIMLKGRQK